ncbi:MAG TPA: response regulator [Candidatus Binatia bacterium]|nr:response regulator [Candidatus Binatia bacterium]
MTAPVRRAVNIIVAEDDDGHARLMERNLRRGGIINAIRRVRDGVELLHGLRSGNRNESEVIFLDINMPRLDGFEVLTQLKADPQLRAIPVIMVTSTDSQREINRAYELGASSYVVKPVGVEAFIDRVRKLGLFLEVVELPGEPLPVGV